MKKFFEKLSQKFGEKVQWQETSPTPHIKVDPQAIVEIVQTLQQDHQFETLTNLGGIDYIKENQLCVFYHLFSYTHNQDIVLKAFLPREENPIIDSISSIYPAADWLERETFDMYGIRFRNHPNLKRLLLPQDWIGYPLRKDYKTPDYYNGMPVPLYFSDMGEEN